MTKGLKTTASGGLALAASVASTLLGYWLLGHFVVATLTFSGWLGPPASGDWRASVKYLARSEWGLLLVGWVALAAVLGMPAYLFARHSRAASGKRLLASMVGRFALLGLLGAGIDALLVAALLAAGRFDFL
jgi:hypothetical protein